VGKPFAASMASRPLAPYKYKDESGSRIDRSILPTLAQRGSPPMSAQPSPVKIPMTALWGVFFLAHIVAAVIARLICEEEINRRALLGALEFFVVFVVIGTAIVLHDRARGTVQTATIYQIKGLVTMLLPACLLGVVGAVVGRWAGYLGDSEAPLIPWAVVGASVGAIVFLGLFWNVAVRLHRPDLIEQAALFMAFVLFATLVTSIPSSSGVYLAILLTQAALRLRSGPRRPAPNWLARFYVGVAVGTFWVLLVTVFAVFVGVFLFADSAALVRTIRARCEITEPTVGLIVLIALALGFLADSRLQGKFSPQMTFLRVVAFAALLLLFLCLQTSESREELAAAIRQASRQGGFVFQCLVAAAAYLTLFDVAGWLHDRCGEEAS
jgi:hypothetical protein